ncbi:MAG: hypothetical protein ACJ8F7_07120 [Gemmataceae bacterium]
MTDSTTAARRRDLLRELLLEYLLVAGLPAWPGADGTTVDEVLQLYAQAAAAGRVPNCGQLLRAHADLAGEVAEFFRPVS